MKPIAIAKAGIIFTLFFFLLNGGTGFADTIKIGVAGVHSGDLAIYGIPSVRAVELAAADINRRGGIRGRRIELLVEDDMCKPEVATRVATTLVEQGVSAVIGHICNGATMAALNIYKDAGVIAISPSATNPKLTSSGRFPNFFRTIDPDDRQSQVMVAFIVEKLGLERIAVLHDKGDYGKGVAEFAKALLDADRRAQVVLYEGIRPGAVDYSSVVQKIKRSRADAVIFGGYHPEASKLVAQMRRQRMKTVFVSDDGVKDETFIKVAQRYAEGVYATGPRDISKNPMTIAVSTAHKKRYGTDPGAFFYNAYAAAIALFNAFERAGSTEVAAVSRALRKERVATPLGTLQFDEKGNKRPFHFSVYQVRNGRFDEVTGEPIAPIQLAQQTTLKSTPENSAETAPIDTAPPRITITSPAVGRGLQLTASGKRITIAGRAVDPAGVAEVLVNRREARLDAQGNFSAQILLKPGQNTIHVTGMDIYENKKTESFTIVREPSDPMPAAAAPSPSQPAGIGPSGTYHALVIGINEYRHLPRLQTARKDAQVVANLLRNDYGFQTKLLLDATRRQILKALNDYRKIIKRSDHLLIYYAGHGEYDKTAQRAYWLPVEASPTDDIDWIIVDTLTSNLRRLQASHILVVADSCYSGTLTRGGITRMASVELRNRYLQKMIRKSSRTLIASGGNEPVADSGGMGHSVFALAFIDGLKEMSTSVFTAEELFYETIKERVAGNALQTPEYHTIRNSGHDGGDFVFIKIRQ